MNDDSSINGLVEAVHERNADVRRAIEQYIDGRHASLVLRHDVGTPKAREAALSAFEDFYYGVTSTLRRNDQLRKDEARLPVGAAGNIQKMDDPYAAGRHRREKAQPQEGWGYD